MMCKKQRIWLVAKSGAVQQSYKVFLLNNQQSIKQLINKLQKELD